MAFDLEGYLQEGREEREQREAAQAEREAKEANQAAWEAKPFYSKAATIISEDVGAIADAAGDRLGKIKDAYSAYYEAQAASRDKYGIYIPTPEVQEAGDNLRGVVLEPVTHPIKSFVGGYINQKADEGSTIAQDVRQSETFLHYFVTPEDKLKKAKEIEETTGISADAFINDDIAYKQALNVYDYKRAKTAVMPEDQAMEAVWQEFPELRNVSLTNPTEAALALHDMDSVRQTHGIVETFNHFIALGNKELEYNNLQYKIMTNRADDNDRERAADLERMIAEDKKVAPSFFDDPLSAIVGGMASSGPEMLQSIREGVRDGLITAGAAALAGAALGTGVEPLGGTLVGGAAGAAGGFVVGTARSVITRATIGQLARAGFGAGIRFGAFEGMRRPETGSRFAEYGNMKDTDGNPLLTDNDRRLYATLGGAANAGIEMANFGIATKPLSRGAVNFLTKGGTDKYAVDAIKGIVDSAKYDVAKRESVAAFAKAQVKDTLKIAATESAEEGAQSIADDLIHNRIVGASDGRAADKAYSIGDIAANALVASVEAIPAGLGFGMASSLGGGSLGSVRHARRLFSEKEKEELAAQKTMTGTVMLNRLQQVASSAKLKETAPDVQQKIIRTQVQGSGFENAYIDTAMAVKKENGLADLKEVAKTAGIRDEELQKTIESGGHLFVPAEKYAQSAASPQLLESVSFSPETDSMARMKENAKMLSDALETAQKRAVHARADIVKSIADEYFPEARENLDEQEKARLYSERDMAKAVIAQNTESPAEGWRSLYHDFTAARDEILQPAIDALSKGMKQGVDILPLGEDGRGIRVSNNAPWYQEYYKEHGKAPNQAQLRDLAYLLTVGDASAPNVDGWIPTTREAAEAMDAARGELDELNGHIQTLENIKERMMKVDSFEIKGSAGLSPEGYKLYRQIIEMLEKIGGEQKEDKQTKVARMNAMLFAHHADIFAAAMRTQEGKEKYTALDYFKDRFALRYGGTDMRQNGLYQSATDVPSAEKEAVRKQYEGTEQWMKAPNGKPTNLTEDQWVAVRTPAFKSWFGDWENDPENASKVVDENGEPLVVYHATREVFDTFKPSKSGWYGSGVYLTSDPNDTSYSMTEPDWHLMPLFAYIYNPLFAGERVSQEEIDAAKKEIADVYRAYKYDEENKAAGSVFSHLEGEEKRAAVIDFLVESLTFSGVEAGKTTRQQLENLIKDACERAGAFYDSPHDGVIVPGNHGGTWFVARERYQVKSATKNNGAYDYGDVNIYHQKDSLEKNVGESAHAIPLDDGQGKVVDIQFVDVDEKRALQSPHIGIRFSDEEYKLGDDVENSHNWVDGNWTDEELDGASTVNVAEPWSYDSLDELKETAIKRLNKAGRYPYDYAYLVAGTSSDYGEDTNESIIRNAEVVGILKLVRESEAESFNQSAWHGSPYDFRAFLLEMIGEGEGRQAHGWGLYFAQNREVSERYKEWLKKAKKKAIHTLTYDGESLNEQPSDIQGVLRGFENYYLDLLRGKSAADVLRMMRDEHVRDKEMHEKKRAEFDVPLALYEENPKISVRALLNSVDKYSSPRLTMEAAESSVPSKRRTAGDLVQALKKSRELYDARAHEEESRIRAIDAVDPDKFNLEVQEPVGKLFRVEIPNDDVLLDEQKPFDEQPKFVREKLEEMFSRADTEQLLYVLSKKDSRFDEVYSDYCELLDHEQDEAYAQEIRQRYNHELSRLIGSNTIPQALLRSFASGQEIYKSISDVFSQLRGDKEASLALNEVGIKGITYDGRQDGRCFVVFDDKAISIIEKFNQMLRQEVRGEISKEDGKRIITLFESADESTFMHEMGHMFLMDLDELAKMDEASAKDLETVNAWAEWHEGAAEEYKDTDFADEFRYHENAILAAKKSGDVVAEKAALERWRQERFARGFEMYLSEGKAPSAAMRSVFRRFKAFLRKIYNLAKNAGAMPSVEVQAVMARMIATENEIAEAKLDERFRPIEKILGKESVESLLGETEAELYQRWTQEAQEEAEDILRKRVMNDLKKEAREEFNQKVEAERERKRAELENDPVYLAEYAMRQGGSTDVVMNWFPSYAAYKKARGKRKTLENELKDYITEYARKLDEQIMQEHLSDENVARAMQTPKAYHRRLAIESAALRRKERLMRLLGGNAPEEVKKKAVAEAKKAESPTRRGTKQEVRKEYERSAYEHERFMREEARAYLREREISESCNPRFFRRNERKYARAMDKAAAAGKWSEVLALKEQQAFAAACAYEAERNEARLNKLVESVKRKLNARTVRLAADERYWLNHIGYLLGLKANDEEKPVKCAKLSELFARYQENIDIDACDPSDLLDVITEGKKRYQEMQLDDFADIVNALGILYNVGRRRNEMLTKSMQGKTTDDILGEIFTDDTALKPSGIVEHPVSEDTGGVGYGELLAKTPFVGKVLAKYGQEGSLLLTKPELIMRLLGEKAHRYLYGTYERAQMKESEILGEKKGELEKIFSVYTRKERMKWKDRNIDAHGDMLSKENVLCLAMNWGTFTNRKRVLDGVGQKFDVIRTLHENMTEKDWKVVQEVWNLLDTFWEESARTEERLNGAHIGKVPAHEFTIKTADGKEVTLKGGYYPLRYNAEKSSNVQDKTAEEAAKGTMTGAQVFGTKRGHTKARVEGDVVLPVLLEFSVLQEHVYNAAHNIAFRIAARDVYRIINDKKFEAYVSSNYGRPVYKYLKQWAVDVWAIPADGTDLAGSTVSRALAAFRRNSTMAIMGWRVWPVVENVSNIAPVVDKLGARRALQAVMAFTLHPKTLLAMSKKSIFMADRINNMERDVRRNSHTFDPTYKPLEFLRDNAYRALAFTDLALSVPTWNSAYNEAFPKAMAQINEENEANKRTYQEAQNRVHELRAEIYDLRREMEEKVDPSLQERIRAKEKEFAEAGIALERAGELPIYDEAERIREAGMRAVQAGDAAVRDTFGSGQTKDLAAIQRSRNEAVKMFTSFYSFFNTQFNAVLESYYGGKYNADGYRHIRVWMPFARSMLYRIILVGLIGGLGKAALGLEGDDDRDKYRNVVDPKTGKTTKVEVPWEERWMNVIGKNTVSTATGMIPLVRDLIGMVTDALFDGTARGRNFEVGSVLSRGGKQAVATWNLIMKKGEDDLKREAEEAKERERVKKMTRKQREKYEEEKKYKKPKKEVGYVDIAKSAAQTVSTFTATRHGITNTPSDGLFSIAQFAVDMMETDNYYDPRVTNVMRAVIFDKKLREKEVPKKPEPPKKKQRRTRGRKERTND